VPEAGDIVRLEFDAHARRKQSGRRPAFVFGPAAYNSRAGVMVCCPTTTRMRGDPFEVALAGTPASVVLAVVPRLRLSKGLTSSSGARLRRGTPLLLLDLLRAEGGA